MKENVLSSLGVGGSPITDDQLDSISPQPNWTESDYRNEYERGALFAGLSNLENTISDFMVKMGNMMSSVMKDTSQKFDQRTLDLLKLALSMYVESMQKSKQFTKRDHMRFVATMHGFVDQYVKNFKER